MKAVVHIDAETHGSNEECSSVEDLIKTVVKEMDENVIEVSIKKRAVKDNSPCITRPENY